MLTFNFHIGDFAKKTSHLSILEKGIYLTLLMRYYDTEKPIPKQPLCYRYANALLPHEKEAVDTILSEFFYEHEGLYFNKRAEEELTRYREKSIKAKTSAKKRWDANAMPTQCEGNANHEPITNNHNNIYIPPKVKKEKRGIYANDLVTSYGVDKEVASDYLAIRTAKKQPLTATALALIQKEAQKASKTLTEALTICCERGWVGFKSDWLKSNNSPLHQPVKYDNEWLKSNAGIDAKAKELGVDISKCPDYQEAKNKIFEHLRNRSNG